MSVPFLFERKIMKKYLAILLFLIIMVDQSPSQLQQDEAIVLSDNARVRARTIQLTKQYNLINAPILLYNAVYR